MTTLRDMTGQYTELLAIASDPDLPPEALADTLEGLEGEIKIKAENIIHILLNSGTDVVALDGEIKRLQARKKSIENGKERLKEYLRFNMEATGITRIECPLFSISLGKGRAIVSIDDEGALPGEYVNTKTTTAPDKRRILAALKDGAVIEGASLTTSEPSLRIK